MLVKCRFTILALVLMTAWPVLAEEPVQPIRLMDPPTTRIVEKPGDSAVLTKDLLYVIDSDVELFLETFPDKMIKIEPVEGPVRQRARFFDSPDKYEVRNFKGKFVYFIEPLGKGVVDLLVIPKGVAKRTDILRRQFPVDGGPAPSIPPGPFTPVDPNNPPINPLVVVPTGLDAKLQSAWGLEPEDQKTDKALLQALKSSWGYPLVKDVSGKDLLDTAATWSDFWMALISVKGPDGKPLVAPLKGKLLITQGQIEKYLKGILPGAEAGPTAITEADKAKARKALAEVVAALGKLS